jgi:hypothetical protein
MRKWYVPTDLLGFDGEHLIAGTCQLTDHRPHRA